MKTLKWNRLREALDKTDILLLELGNVYIHRGWYLCLPGELSERGVLKISDFRDWPKTIEKRKKQQWGKTQILTTYCLSWQLCMSFPRINLAGTPSAGRKAVRMEGTPLLSGYRVDHWGQQLQEFPKRVHYSHQRMMPWASFLGIRWWRRIPSLMKAQIYTKESAFWTTNIIN